MDFKIRNEKEKGKEQDEGTKRCLKGGSFCGNYFVHVDLGTESYTKISLV